MRLQNIPDTLDTLPPLTNLSLLSPHRVLVIGCAYGGISVVVNLLDLSLGQGRDTVYPVSDLKGKKSRHGLKLTVIDERDGYFHSVGAPLAHTTPKHTSNMWKRYSRLKELQHPNLKFKHGSVQKIDPESKVAAWMDRSGQLQKQEYDYVVVATGLKRHWPAVPKSGSFEEYMKDSKELVDKITGGDTNVKDRKVVVVGAGAVGVEFAGEIRNYYPHISVTLIHSRSEVLSSEPLPSEVKAKAKMLLEDEGVDLILGQRATINELPNGKFEVTLANGQTITAELALDTTKKGLATTSFLPAETLNEEQEIKVTPNLTFQATIPNAASHFGVGDVIAWSGIKRAGGAMVMGQLAAANIYASILNAENTTSSPIALAELPHYPNVIGLAVGKHCLTYDKQNGMKWGVELMSSYFQDDLGWKANLRYLKLTDGEEEEGSAKKVEDKVVVKIKRASMGKIGVEAVAAVAAVAAA